MLSSVTTSDLEMAYADSGDAGGRTVVLLHGWPDSAASWDVIGPALARAGARVVVPELRGHGHTRFRDASIARSGQLTALGKDVAELIEQLKLNDVILVGHDWGARAAYVVGAAFPKRIDRLICMSSAYATQTFPEADRYRVAEAHWYEWFLATEFGRKAFETDRKALCRYLWTTWSPNWAFDEAHFNRVATAWDNEDWFEITRHAYMHRWGEAAGYPAYDELEAQLAQSPAIQRPTTMLHGSDDPNRPSTSAGKERYFPKGYDRRVLEGVGHFIPGEAPHVVLDAIMEHL